MAKEMVVNRPDEAAMRRLLARTEDEPAGAIVGLAWMAGLLREEITELRWEQISFLTHQIELKDRNVPLEEELEALLKGYYARFGRGAEHVVISQRFRQKMQPQAVSRIARRELDAEGQRAVRLVDLRHDYIIRQMERHPLPYVARISGVEIRALRLHFAPYITADRAGSAQRGGGVDEFKLWKVLQAEKDTPAGLALWLTWQMAMTGSEIIALTWDQVDLDKRVLHLPGRTVAISSAVERMLRQREERRGSDPRVLVSEKSRRGMDLSRLSRVTRAALVRGGLENVTLKEIWQLAQQNREDALILEQVQKKGMVARREVMELLGITKSAAYARLHRLVESGTLVRVGGKYYRSGTVVPPEQQKEAILRYLEQEGCAYRQDIAAVLHVQRRQCSVVLRRMVADGELVRVDQKYSLKNA